MVENLVKFEGDSRHPNHEAFLLELGKATYSAAKVAGICFDLLRVTGGAESASMYSDPLGRLENRLKRLHASQSDNQGLADFLTGLGPARELRNDLLHALPVQNGLHRRKTDDLAYVRDFFSVSDLAEVTSGLSRVAGQGNSLLYADGGAAVRGWYSAGGS